MTWFRSLHQRIFGLGSPATLGLYRILIGFLALANWLLIHPFRDVWFSEKGFLPSPVALQYSGREPRFDPLTLLASDPFMHTAWWLMGLFCLLVLVGFQTRIATIVLFVLTVAFHHRNPVILHSGDTMLRASLFMLAISPSGRAFSVDAWLRARKGISPGLIGEWTRVMIQVQLAIVYGTTVIHKAFGSLWLDGTAAWYPTRLSEFERFPVPEFMDSQPMIQIATYGTLLVEIALATLVFHPRFRGFILLGGLILHGFIEYRMNIPLFAFLMCAQYVSHYSGEEVMSFLSKLSQRRSLVENSG